MAFYSTATNLVTSTNHLLAEVYVRDLVQGITYWASTNAQSVLNLATSSNYAMSTNGQYIAYQSTGSFGGMIFRYNLATGVTDRVFTNGIVAASLDQDARNLDISADGNFIAFTTTNNVGAIAMVSP